MSSTESQSVDFDPDTDQTQISQVFQSDQDLISLPQGFHKNILASINLDPLPYLAVAQSTF